MFFVDSPFQTQVLPGADASKVKVKGLDQGTVPASLPLNFTIDTREAGNAELDICIQVIKQMAFIVPIKLSDVDRQRKFCNITFYCIMSQFKIHSFI